MISTNVVAMRVEVPEDLRAELHFNYLNELISGKELVAECVRLEIEVTDIIDMDIIDLLD